MWARPILRAIALQTLVNTETRCPHATTFTCRCWNSDCVGIHMRKRLTRLGDCRFDICIYECGCKRRRHRSSPLALEDEAIHFHHLRGLGHPPDNLLVNRLGTRQAARLRSTNSMTARAVHPPGAGAGAGWERAGGGGPKCGHAPRANQEFEGGHHLLVRYVDVHSHGWRESCHRDPASRALRTLGGPCTWLSAGEGRDSGCLLPVIKLHNEAGTRFLRCSAVQMMFRV